MIHLLFGFFVTMGLIYPAFSSGEGSGGSIKKSFSNMTPRQAFNASHFDQKIMNVQFPGTSTWMNPAKDLCMSGDQLQTVRPRRVCTVWWVDLKENEFGSKISTHTNYYDALNKSQSRNGRSKPYCPNELAHHVIYSASSMRTHFVVKFYEKVQGKSRYSHSHYLGEYIYPIPDCSEFELLNPDVFIRLTGGEGSGGSNKKRSL